MNNSSSKKLKVFLALVLIMGGLLFGGATSFAQGPTGTGSEPQGGEGLDSEAMGRGLGQDTPADNRYAGDAKVTASGSILTGTFFLGVFANITDGLARFDPFSADTITTQGAGVGTAIENANRFILNLANLFYILVLLLIAIATIFGIEAYGVQKLLPKLVIAILLSNFGLFIVRLITTTAQSLQVSLLQGADGQNIAQIFIESAGVAENLGRWGARIALGIVSYFTGGLTVPLQFMFEAAQPINWFTVAFMLIAVVLVLRIVGLWILAIFAPIGIVLGVLPATAGQAKTYWRKVISYAFAGPLMIFFLRLAAIVWKSLDNSTQLVAELDGQKLETGYASNTFLQALLTVTVLYIGLIITRKLGVEVANWTIGAFQKAFKTAFSASLAFGAGGVKAVGSLLGAGKFAETTGMSLASRASSLSSEGQRLRGAQYLGLATTFSKIAGGKKEGFFGNAAKVFETASSPLLEDKKGAAKIFRAAGLSRGAERAWENLQREEPSLAQEVSANPPAFADRISRETDPTRREGLILGAIEAGKIVDAYDPANNINATNSILWSDITRWIRPGQISIMQGKAALRDPRLSEDYQSATTDDARNNVLRNQLRRQDVSQLNAAALGNQNIAQALFDVRKVDLPKFFKQWSDRQNRAFGTGLAASLDNIGTDEGSDRRWRDVARTALEKGANPDIIFSQQRMAAQPARRFLMRDAVMNAAAGSASAYRLQSPAGALALARMAPVENIGKFVKLLPKQLQQALRQEARTVVGNAPPAVGAPQLSQERALEILGNIGVQIANNP